MDITYQIIIAISGLFSLWVGLSIIIVNIKLGKTNEILNDIRDILIKTATPSSPPTNPPSGNNKEAESTDNSYYPTA